MHSPHAGFFARNNPVGHTAQFCGDGDAHFGVREGKKLLSRIREGVIRTTLGTVDLLPGLGTRTRVAAQPRETLGV
jgi:hypothetical protein